MVSSDGFLSNMVYRDGFLSNMVSSGGFLANMVSSDGFLANMVSSDGFLSNMVSRHQPYSQRILEISLPHRSCLKMVENAWKENPLYCLEEASVGECCRR
ncbi:hypothetical protein AVEN_22900-1 [Araneus ventricosus]|uniref:Uncharacterized protein n=1 Tax=Araneus ventricosus TaxID=182803 RepID=A0A4Y2D656_ARAVE|nr:hypothetical protein AVEN_22900-1 [Araneus ventricosus]